MDLLSTEAILKARFKGDSKKNKWNSNWKPRLL